MLVCNTKTMRNAYEMYKRSTKTYLHECYAKPSHAKQEAYNYCKRRWYQYNGVIDSDTFIRILGYNCMQFSVGFIGTYNERPAFFYITRTYDRVMYLD